MYRLQVQRTIESIVVEGEWIPSTEFERSPVLASEHSLNPEHLRNTKPSTSIQTSSSLSHSCCIPNGKENHPDEKDIGKNERRRVWTPGLAPTYRHTEQLCVYRVLRSSFLLNCDPTTGRSDKLSSLDNVSQGHGNGVLVKHLSKVCFPQSIGKCEIH